jgi:hypothetical protein
MNLSIKLWDNECWKMNTTVCCCDWHVQDGASSSARDVFVNRSDVYICVCRFCVWRTHESGKGHCVIGRTVFCFGVKQLLKFVTSACLCISLDPKPKKGSLIAKSVSETRFALGRPSLPVQVASVSFVVWQRRRKSAIFVTCWNVSDRNIFAHLFSQASSETV